MDTSGLLHQVNIIQQKTVISFSRPHDRDVTFEVGDELGEGGFGKVLLVRKNTRLFALKLVSVRNDEMVVNEFQNQHSCNNPNVLAVYAYGKAEMFSHLLMEYCEKGTFYEVLKQDGRFEEPETTMAVSQIANGLAYCHENKIIHRDIKLENILVLADGIVH